MAARLNPRHQEMVRDKIKASQLINALQNHVLEGKEMAPSAVTAALGLLKKVLPDTVSSSVTVTHERPLTYAERIAQEQAASSPGDAGGSVGDTVQ